MPACALITCKNRSDTINSSNSGVTYHSFPKDAKIKEKWLEVTARGPNWFPTKTSSICSVHFEQKCFQLLKKNKRLFPWAVPTVRIPVVKSVIKGQDINVTASTSTSTSHLKEITFDDRSVYAEDESVEQVAMSSLNPKTSADAVEPIAETPRKRKLRSKLEHCQNVIKRQKTRIKTLQKKTSRYQKKIKELKDILIELKEKNLVSCDQAHQLGDMGVNDLIKRYENKLSTDQASKSKYSPHLRAFACTLHFYSPKAYEYVRQKFDTCLPHSRTIKKWYESVDGSPGFTKESFEAIKLKVQSTNYKLFGNLVMDEMSIRQRIEWDGKEMHGYVNICDKGAKGDHLPEAKQALVLLVTAINGAWKLPVAYFLVDGVTGIQRANLVKQALFRVT